MESKSIPKLSMFNTNYFKALRAQAENKDNVSQDNSNFTFKLLSTLCALSASLAVAVLIWSIIAPTLIAAKVIAVTSSAVALGSVIGLCFFRPKVMDSDSVAKQSLLEGEQSCSASI